MKRESKTVYVTDSNIELLVLKPESNQAYVSVCHCNADMLEELGSACMAAADELRSLALESAT